MRANRRFHPKKDAKYDEASVRPTAHAKQFKTKTPGRIATKHFPHDMLP